MAGSLRPAMNSSWDAREQQLSLLFCRAPGSSTWNLLNQGKIFTPNVEAESKDYKRIGDSKVQTKYGPAKTTATIAVYLEDDLHDMATILGQVVVGSWVGTEELRLDTTKVRDFMVINYDGTTPGVSQAVSVEYLNSFRPGKWSGMNLDADASDARVAQLDGSAADYYVMPIAGQAHS